MSEISDLDSPAGLAEDIDAPREKGEHITRVGIIFSGGPAPAANAVISAAAISFMDAGRQVLGFFHGYSSLQEYHPITHRLLPDVHYRIFTEKDVLGVRNTRGILIGTSRVNPGTGIEGPADLSDPKKTMKLRTVYNALADLEIDALISIGGDDTLKTANYLYLFQKLLPPEAHHTQIIHLPKTIDNDYLGIDFTFGFFTAVDVMAKEVQNLRADAEASGSWFVVETMGRKAGWLTYGVGIAGEADFIVAVEDLDDRWLVEEEVEVRGERRIELRLDPIALGDHVVNLILSRERHGKPFGTVVLAEGLGERLSERILATTPRDEHGHIALGRLDIGKMMANIISDRYRARTGHDRKVTGIQLGYESRCAPPHAYDVMLGSQLGIGAYRALIEENLDGHMVSVSGQLDLAYVPFHRLVNPASLKTEVRLIRPASDFHRLARFLEAHIDPIVDWRPGQDGA
jgi:ATP-dependent phosphofructokinase / diphosphate-dependent phosphofructokinase